MKSSFLIIAATAIAISAAALAEQAPATTGPEGLEHGKRHEMMREHMKNATPEERERMKAHHKKMREKWQNASPEERKKMRKHCEMKRKGKGHGEKAAHEKSMGGEGRALLKDVNQFPRRHQAR